MLRGTSIDQGAWGVWGWSPRVAGLAKLATLVLRSPKKEDFEYNFAWTGAKCSDLVDGVRAQATHLARLIRRDQKSWKGGIVQIRIGINDLGGRPVLDDVASNAEPSRARAAVHSCIQAIGDAVSEVQEAEPSVKFVLVGILNNADWPPYFQHWQDSTSQARINSLLDQFDEGLRRLAERSETISFFDDRAWFRGYWGARDSEGHPNYKCLRLANGQTIENTQGDAPQNAILADGHGGTLLNALWARDFVRFINFEFGLQVPEIGDQEFLRFVEEITE